MSELLIKNGCVFTYIHEGYHALKLRDADVLIENGAIVKIAPDIKASCETLDASGCLVLPGMINLESRAVASFLLRGLLQDKSWERYGGTPVYARILPIIRLALDMLEEKSLEAIAAVSLWEGLSGGTTTAVDICPPEMSAPVKKAAEKLGMRLYTAVERRDRSDPSVMPGGSYKPGDEIASEKHEDGDFPAIFSPETASVELIRELSKTDGSRFTRAAYSDYEDRTINKLSDLGFLRADTVLCQCVLAGKHDIELIRSAGGSAALSAIACAQEGKRFPALDFLRGGVNTALATGFYGNCMISEMKAAAFAAKLDEGNGGQYQATDAFYAATVAGAKALGLQDKLGRVDIGMNGDVSVVSMERFMPLSYPFIQYLYGASPADVKHVVCGGRACKRDFKPEADTVLEEARSHAGEALKAVWDAAIKYVL